MEQTCNIYIYIYVCVCGEIFTEHLSRLFTAINTHGYQPEDILLGTITSIPKDRKGNICDAETTEELPNAVSFQS